MPYAKQTWADLDPARPLSAVRMNHIEDGIAAVDTAITNGLAAEVTARDAAIASALGAVVAPTYAQATSATSTTGTTYVIVPGMSRSVAANASYLVTYWMVVRSTVATTDVDFRINGPAGATEAEDGALPVAVTGVDPPSAGTDYEVELVALINTSATAGTLSIYFRASTTADSATVTVQQGSRMRLERIG